MQRYCHQAAQGTQTPASRHNAISTRRKMRVTCHKNVRCRKKTELAGIFHPFGTCPAMRGKKAYAACLQVYSPLRTTALHSHQCVPLRRLLSATITTPCAMPTTPLQPRPVPPGALSMHIPRIGWARGLARGWHPKHPARLARCAAGRCLWRRSICCLRTG